MPERQPIPIRRGLRQELDDLERLIATDGDPVPDLGRLAEPARLDFLFRLELAAILRAGPGAEVSPRRLLAAAARAAAAGALPLATAAALRRTLRRLTERLYAAGAWHPARPLWWSPLAQPAPVERWWRGAGEIEEALRIGRDRLAAAFSEDPAAPRWLGLPELVPASLIRDLHDQLEAAHDADALALERAGVGAGGEVSSRRGDSVLYLTGLEPELTAAAPAAAALAQWCLAHVARRLAQATGLAIHAPGKVMLARYPAPSAGYHPHLDNPGGDDDNGRALTLVVYLNASGRECSGGEIAVWGPGVATSEAPAAVLPAAGGSGVLFDARAVAHQVRPVGEGPARWALTLWLDDAPQEPVPLSPPVPEPSLSDVLLPIDDPPLPPGKVPFHELSDGVAGAIASGRITVYGVEPARPRVGVVATVYRGGAALDAWCEHHLALGVDHLVLVFDRLEEPAEAAGAERLAARHSRERLTVWSGSRVATERWCALAADARGDLERYARSGAACWAVAARQTLNASAVLEAARGDELGGAPLDWLLHLDADELLYLEGAGRGGASVGEHFSAATAAGLHLLRYANHELLNRTGGPLRFKRNPHLAAARLGSAGWSALAGHLEMAQTDPRPYFTGYFNGKSAVAVAHGVAAAGVHGWRLETPDPARSRFLAGPSILHCHFPDAAAFRRKYLAAEAAGDPPDPPLFEPSPVEVAAFERIRSLRRDGADVERGLDRMHETLTTFSDADVELLEAAGLIFEPKLALSFSRG